MGINPSLLIIASEKVGTGSYLPMTFYTGGSERVRIDTSGNVGIGTSSPTAKLSVNGIIAQISQGTASAQYRCVNSGGTFYYALDSSTGSSFGAAYAAVLWHSGNYPMIFATNDAERMRIDSSGNVGIGTSSPATKLHVNTGAAGYGITVAANFQTASTYQIGIDSNSSLAIYDSSAAAQRLVLTSGGEVYIAGTTDQGAYNLQVNGTGVWGAGAYVNGSDARLKDDVQDLASALDVVTALRPVTFKYKAGYSKDQSVQSGFIAQELQQAMEGQAYVNGVVQAGPEYLNVAYQSLIPVLTKAIQEQQALINDLRARVAQLETKGA